MQKNFWVKNGVLGEMSMQRDFCAKIGVWGKWVCKGLLGNIGVLREMGMQRNISVKDEVLGENGCAKGLLG